VEVTRYGIKNKTRDIKPLFVGAGEPTRVATNIGLTPQVTDVESELEKASLAVEAGSDIISDVSIDSNYREFLLRLISKESVPIATVPLYGVCVKALENSGALINFDPKDIMEEIEYQAKLGVDIVTIHATLTKDVLGGLRNSNRLIKIPSRGGALIAAYMIKSNRENPLYEYFDEILDIARTYGVTVSVGASLRPGSIVDGLDTFYLREIQVQGYLTRLAIDKGVHVMVEGIGHLRADLIPVAVKLHKEICYGVPFRPLPVCTDIATGHDHIASSIAATVCALSGGDILSVITRGEHVGLPRIQDIVEGVKTFRIAAHIADTVKLKELNQEEQISKARSIRKWKEIFKYALYPEDARELHGKLSRSMNADSCSMCGSFCALKIVNAYMNKEVT
jgi:phosphomethylpyrimidine synthase